MLRSKGVWGQDSPLKGQALSGWAFWIMSLAAQFPELTECGECLLWPGGSWLVFSVESGVLGLCRPVLFDARRDTTSNHRVLLLCQGMSSPSHSASLMQERHSSLLKAPLRTEGLSPVSSGGNGLWGGAVWVLACRVREEDKKGKRIGGYGSRSLLFKLE